MSIDIDNKLKFLHQAWPSNAILTTHALKANGFSDQLIQKYCHSGWLRRIGVGGFVRQNDRPIWQGGLYAIQHQLKKNIHLGGLTALELSGLAHYLRLAPEKVTIHFYLYNTSATKIKLPGWFIKYFNKKVTFTYKQCHIFNEEIGLTTQIMEGLEIIVSEPERAILELLYLVPDTVSIEDATYLVENLQTIRPESMQAMLENCRHILIKRLFLCLADLCQLPVLEYLNLNRITLGSGERTIGSGKKYFSKYKLLLRNDVSNPEEDINV